MALDSARLSSALQSAIESAFNLGAVAGYDSAELKKFTDAVAESVIDEFVNNAELSSASLDNTAVSGTVDTTSSNPAEPLAGGQVDNGSVSGGIV